jgi:uncharacterized protein YjbJ (UPF0337 family)
MEGNVWKGKLKGSRVGIKEQFEEMMDDDEISEIEGKLELMSELLEEYGDLKYDAEDHYTIFE